MTEAGGYADPFLDTHGKAIIHALHKCANAKMVSACRQDDILYNDIPMPCSLTHAVAQGATMIQQLYMPFLNRVMAEAAGRTLSCREIDAFRSEIISSFKHPADKKVLGGKGENRAFQDELLRPKGLRMHLCYQIRRRRKHVTRLENMIFLAERALNVAPSHVLLKNARSLLQDLEEVFVFSAQHILS